MALFSEELDALPGVLRLGRATRRTIHLNIAASVLTKVLRPHCQAAPFVARCCKQGVQGWSSDILSLWYQW